MKTLYSPCLKHSIIIAWLLCFFSLTLSLVNAQLVPTKNEDPKQAYTETLINSLTLGASTLPKTQNSTGGLSVHAKPGVIILNNGAKLTGLMSPNEHGYRIAYNQGSQIIPFEYIDCVGDTLAEVYEKKVQEIKDPTLADHLKLAKQCHGWGYKEGVIAQLELAILKDENHPEINQLAEIYLKKNQDASNKVIQAGNKQSSNSSRPLPREVAKYRNLHQMPPETKGQLPPLPGLDHEQSRIFSTTIQPILQARCGNARCHGGMATQTFHVEWINRDQHISRKRLEDTLRSVLNQVDRDRPESSAIIVKAQQDDGKHGPAIWNTVIARQNQQQLSEYIYSLQRPVAKTQTTPTTQEAKLKTLSKDQAPDLKPVPEVIQSSMKDQKVEQAVALTSTPPATHPKFERFQRQQQPDAFDPDDFNRQP